MVRHVSIKVSNKGVAEVTGYYTRNQREIACTLETEKRMSYPNLPLSACMRRNEGVIIRDFRV